MLDLPMAQAFLYMDMDMEERELQEKKEQQKFWLDYLSRLFSNPPQPGENSEFVNAREAFVSAIQPPEMKTKKEYSWNIPKEILEQYEKQPVIVQDEVLGKGG